MVRRARRQILRQPSMIWSVTGAFLLLVLVAGGTLLAVRATRGWMSTAGQGVSVLVFFREETTSEQATQMATLLQRTSGVSQVRLVEPDEALARLRNAEQRFGSSDWTNDLEPGYFPRSLEVSLAPTSDIAQRASQLAQRLRGLPGVAQVDAMADGVARLDSWIRFARRLGWTVVLATAIAAVVLLIGTVVRGRELRRRYAQVLLLLGETKGQARMPSNILLAIAGFLGAALALLALRLAWPALLVSVERWLSLSSGAPTLLGVGESVLCVAAASAFGWLLGYLSTPVVDGADA